MTTNQLYARSKMHVIVRSEIGLGPRSVSARRRLQTFGLIFRQNCELFVDCSFWQKVKRSANFQGKLLSDVSKRVQ